MVTCKGSGRRPRPQYPRLSAVFTVVRWYDRACNLYGCTPCPKCDGVHRATMRLKDGVRVADDVVGWVPIVECFDCGFAQRAVLEPALGHVRDEGGPLMEAYEPAWISVRPVFEETNERGTVVARFRWEVRTATGAVSGEALTEDDAKMAALMACGHLR